MTPTLTARLLVLALCLVAACGRVPAAPEPPAAWSFALAVTDEDDGGPLADAQVAIADPAARSVAARWTPHGWSAARPPRAGDEIWVLAPHHDARTLPVPRGAGVKEVRLRRARGAHRLRVVLEPAGTPLDAELDVVHAAAGAWRLEGDVEGAATPVLLSERLRARGGELRVEVPAGLVTTARVVCTDAFAWPWFADCADGGATVLHVERLRSLPVLLPAGTPPAAFSARVLPDRASPVGGDSHRAASLLAALDSAPLGRCRRGGTQAFIDAVPPVRCHVFGRVGEIPFAATLAPDATSLDLRALPPARLLSSEPLLDGMPLAAGGLVAPGRLDLAAAAALAASASRATRGAFVVRSADAWVPAALPAADWITLWHPGAGLAHVPWHDDVPVQAASGPGEILFRLSSAGSGAASIAVWPSAAAGGRLFSRPGILGLRRHTEPDGTLRVCGLPLGTYRFDRQRPGCGSDAGAVVETGSVTLTADDPRRTVALAADP